MKQLTLVRHAKSSWEYNLDDRHRPLAERGMKDAPKVAAKYLKTMTMPDAVFSSPAKRALSTCQIFMEHLNIPEERLNIVEALYDFGGSSVARFIKSLDNEYQNVMIFGHNHAFTSISNIFGSQYIDNVPTSGLVSIQFTPDNWKDIEKGQTVLTIFPKHLK